MNLLEQLALAGQALRHTLPQLFRPRLWLWAAPLAAAQLLVVAALWNAAHPLVSWFMAPLLVRASGAGTLHYPRLFELLPSLFERADLVVGAVIGSIAFGAATPAFARSFRGEPVRARAALAEGLARAPQLVLVLLPFNLLLVGVGLAAARVLGPRFASPTLAPLLPIVVAAASVWIQAAWFYAVALVVLERRSALSALRALPSTWSSGFVAALLVSAVTLLLLAALRLPGISAALLVEKGVPELAGWLTVWHIATGLLNAFILTAAATLLYLSAVAPRESGA